MESFLVYVLEYMLTLVSLDKMLIVCILTKQKTFT